MASKTRLFDTCDMGTSRVPPAQEANAAVKLKGPGGKGAEAHQGAAARA